MTIVVVPSNELVIDIFPDDGLTGNARLREIIDLFFSAPEGAVITKIGTGLSYVTPASSGSDGAIRVPFNWGDATPKTIITLPANTTVFTAQIVIQTPFNGTGATLRLGDSGNLSRLIATAQNDPTSALTFTSAPAYTYTSSTSILLSITPGSSASAGSGFVLLTI